MEALPVMKTFRRFVVFVMGVTMTATAVGSQLPGLPGSAAETAKIVHFRVSGPLLERPAGETLTLTLEQPVTLQELIARMKKARDDQSVKAVVLTFRQPSMGFAQLQELREAIMDIRAVDKDVYVHADMLSTGLYALACAASHVSIVPTGDVWLTGLYAEQPYLRGLLDKIGVVPEFIQMGDYKSAAEILTRTGPSEPADEMLTWLLDSLYESLVSMIAESRGMPPDKVKEIIDTGPHTADKALELGLIDSVQHRQDFVARLKERYGDAAKIVRRYGEDRGPGDRLLESAHGPMGSDRGSDEEGPEADKAGCGGGVRGRPDHGRLGGPESVRSFGAGAEHDDPQGAGQGGERPGGKSGRAASGLARGIGAGQRDHLGRHATGEAE